MGSWRPCGFVVFLPRVVVLDKTASPPPPFLSPAQVSRVAVAAMTSVQLEPIWVPIWVPL